MDQNPAISTRSIQINLVNKTAKINKKLLFAGLLVLELLIFWGDYYTGPLAPFSHFYLVPIVIAAFFLDQDKAYLLAFLASAGEASVFQQLLETFNLTEVLLNFISGAAMFFITAYLAIQLRKQLKILKEYADQDALTKANSRRYFYEQGAAELMRSFRYRHPMTIAFIDLDNFKEVNDKQGHIVGDQLLVKTAAMIKSDLRVGDLVGRLGGDEFGILLNETDQEQAKIIIDRMKANLLGAIAPYQTKVTFSIGVVTYLADKPICFDELVELADKAMYSIKSQTKNDNKFIV